MSLWYGEHSAVARDHLHVVRDAVQLAHPEKAAQGPSSWLAVNWERSMLDHPGRFDYGSYRRQVTGDP